MDAMRLGRTLCFLCLLVLLALSHCIAGFELREGERVFCVVTWWCATEESFKTATHLSAGLSIALT